MTVGLLTIHALCASTIKWCRSPCNTRDVMIYSRGKYSSNFSVDDGSFLSKRSSNIKLALALLFYSEQFRTFFPPCLPFSIWFSILVLTSPPREIMAILQPLFQLQKRPKFIRPRPELKMHRFFSSVPPQQSSSGRAFDWWLIQISCMLAIMYIWDPGFRAWGGLIQLLTCMSFQGLMSFCSVTIMGTLLCSLSFLCGIWIPATIVLVWGRQEFQTPAGKLLKYIMSDFGFSILSKHQYWRRNFLWLYSQ